MDITIERLRDALFVMLLILLIYILYKRLLVFLNKQTAKGSYAGFDGARSSIKEGVLKMSFNVPEETHATIEVRDDKNEVVKLLIKQDLVAKHHEFEFDVSDLKSGTYSYHLITHNQHSSRNFRI